MEGFTLSPSSSNSPFLPATFNAIDALPWSNALSAHARKSTQEYARARKLHCLNLPPILDMHARARPLPQTLCENRTAGERREPLPVLNGQKPPPGQGRRSKILAAGGGGGGCGGLRERMAGLSMPPPPPIGFFFRIATIKMESCQMWIIVPPLRVRTFTRSEVVILRGGGGANSILGMRPKGRTQLVQAEVFCLVFFF